MQILGIHLVTSYGSVPGRSKKIPPSQHPPLSWQSYPFFIFRFFFCSFSFISLSFPITQNSIAFSFEDVILHILIISFNSLFPRLTSFLLFFYCIPQNFVKVYNVIHFCIYLCSCSNLNAIIRYSATTHIRFHETRGSRFYLGRISVLISICR